jgi:hypothetical protein
MKLNLYILIMLYTLFLFDCKNKNADENSIKKREYVEKPIEIDTFYLKDLISKWKEEKNNYSEKIGNVSLGNLLESAEKELKKLNLNLVFKNPQKSNNFDFVYKKSTDICYNKIVDHYLIYNDSFDRIIYVKQINKKEPNFDFYFAYMYDYEYIFWSSSWSEVKIDNGFFIKEKNMSSIMYIGNERGYLPSTFGTRSIMLVDNHLLPVKQTKWTENGELVSNTDFVYKGDLSYCEIAKPFKSMKLGRNTKFKEIYKLFDTKFQKTKVTIYAPFFPVSYLHIPYWFYNGNYINGDVFELSIPDSTH